MSDLQVILETIKRRVAEAIADLTGLDPEVSDINSRAEPRRVPYARVGIAELAHSDFTISSDSLMIGIQVVAVVSRNNEQPQVVQFRLAEALHKAIFGEYYERSIIELESGRAVRLIPSTRTSFLSDVEQAIAERMPDYTSVAITLTAELPLGGRVF